MMRILAAALSLLLASAPYAEAARFVAPKFKTGAPLTGQNVRLTLPALTLQPNALTGGSGSVLPTLKVDGSPAAAVPQVLPGAGVNAQLPVFSEGSNVLPEGQAWNGATAEQSQALDQRFAELNASFENKDPGFVESSNGSGSVPLSNSSLKDSGSDDGPPKPPKKDGGSGPSRGWFGFSRGVAFLLLAMGVAQIGVEAQAAATPTLIAKVFGDVTISANLGIVSSITDIVGTIIAPAVIKKLGLKKAFVSATILRLAAGGVMAGLVAAGWLTVPAMMVIYGLSSLVWGISYTAERSMPAVLLNQDQARMERFRGARQILIEVVATLVPIGTGALVAAAGFMPAMIAFPVALLVSVAIVAKTLDIPAKLQAASELARDAAGPTSFFKSLGRGAAVVAKTPALAWSLVSYAFYWLMNPMLYWLVAPAFGIWVTGNEEKGAFVSGILTGVFSLGGLAAGLMITRLKPKDMRLSMLRWMDATTLTLLLFGLFAFGSTPLAAAALLVFGTAQVMAKIKLESYFQARAPMENVDDVTAALEAFSLVMTTIGLYALKLMFGADPGQDAFLWLAAAMVPLAVVYYLLRRGLAKASK